MAVPPFFSSIPPVGGKKKKRRKRRGSLKRDPRCSSTRANITLSIPREKKEKKAQEERNKSETLLGQAHRKFRPLPLSQEKKKRRGRGSGDHSREKEERRKKGKSNVFVRLIAVRGLIAQLLL